YLPHVEAFYEMVSLAGLHTESILEFFLSLRCVWFGSISVYKESVRCKGQRLLLL
ncbi:hypothetical protein GCK32_010927, partial [Trichostrongylus colubriformis]